MPFKNRNRRYTEDEIERMRRLADAGYSRFDIAVALGRSPGSVNGTCHYYKIRTKGGPGGTPSWRTPRSVRTSTQEVM